MFTNLGELFQLPGIISVPELKTFRILFGGKKMSKKKIILKKYISLLIVFAMLFGRCYFTEVNAESEDIVMDTLTISNEPVMIEELVEMEEPAVEEEQEGSMESEGEIIYDPQPTKLEEVRAAIDAYEAEYQAVLAAEGFQTALEVSKPHWQYEVAPELMPEGYQCEFVDWDEDFGTEYYTFFSDIAPVAVVQVTSLSELAAAISNAAATGTVIDIIQDINLNGINNPITINDDSTNRGNLRVALTIPRGKSITIMSSNGSRLIKTDTLSGYSCRHIGVKGTLTLKDITLTGNKTSGGVQIMQGNASGSVKGGSLVLEAGVNIMDCRSGYFGGGVHVGAFASLTINEGVEISGCTGDVGGGVCANGGGIGVATLLINGGSIVNNASYGGGVCIASCNFTMNGGEITGNSTTNVGGGVYISNNNNVIASSFVMNGGSIHDNTATDNTSAYGGGVAIVGTGTAGATFGMYGGEISGNIVTNYGGGVAINSAYGTFTMYDNAESPPIISNNSASKGGGVYAAAVTTSGRSATFNMNGGVISNNTASAHGGGAYAAATSTSVRGILNMTGGEIKNNSAPGGDGGGIYTELATYLISSGAYSNLTIGESAIFSGNSASVAYMYNGTPIYNNIVSRSASFAFPDDSTHPLNNYDINYRRDNGDLTLYTVTVKYVDTQGEPVKESDITQVVNGQTYTYTVPDIDDYELVNWKWNEELKNDLEPTTSFTVAGNTIITLIYNVEAISIPFSFYKVEAPDYEKYLPGAEFDLYKWTGEGTPEKDLTDTADPNWDYRGHLTGNEARFEITFEELGVYQLIETKAPAGYQLPAGQWQINVEKDGTIGIEAVGSAKPPAFKGEGTDEDPYLMGNIKNYEMPVTGSAGAFFFTVAGMFLLMCGATWMIFRLRRRLDE